MDRRKRLLLAMGGVAVVAIFSPYAFWHPVWLNHDGFGQIRAGMTQPEVEHLMGGPPGMYYPAHGGGGDMTCEGVIVPNAVVEANWCDDKRRYEVYFDDGGRVAGTHRRIGWSATAITSRIFAPFYGVRKPVPLEPRRFQSSDPMSK